MQIQRLRDAGWGFLAGLLMLATVSDTRAQSSLPIYSDSMVNGWEDWSWALANLTNTTPVHSGSASIHVTAAAWEALSVHHAELDMNLYSALSFWAHGGSGGGQRLQVYADYGTTSTPAYLLPALAANAWQQFEIPLADLGVATATDLNRFSIQLRNDGTAGSFFVDDIELTRMPTLLGDYNGNDIIDAADYTAWRDAVTAGATELLNDPTPGTVDESDFSYWRAHFGGTLGVGAGSAAAVPEPSGFALAALTSGGLLLVRRRRVAKLINA